MAFQVKLSALLTDIMSWSTKKLICNRTKVYEALSSVEMLLLILEKYRELDQQKLSENSRRAEELMSPSQTRTFALMDTSEAVSPESKFCELVSNVLRKVSILLKLYDYLFEINFKEKDLVPLGKLIAGIHENDKA